MKKKTCNSSRYIVFKFLMFFFFLFKYNIKYKTVIISIHLKTKGLYVQWHETILSKDAPRIPQNTIIFQYLVNTVLLVCTIGTKVTCRIALIVTILCIRSIYIYLYDIPISYRHSSPFSFYTSSWPTVKSEKYQVFV